MDPGPLGNNTSDNAATRPDLSATSEVGSARASSPSADNPWRMLYEMQSKHMLELIEAIKKPEAPQSSIMLPEFNPELPGADSRAWCSTVDICLTERPLVGGALIIALSKALKGNASQWLSQISHAGMTWHQFKDLFLARYDLVETCAAMFININNGRPKDGEGMADYASRLLTSLSVQWQNEDKEKIAVSFVLAHIAQFDNRLHRLAFTNDISTRTNLLQEIKALSSLKRKTPFDRDPNSDSKKKMMSTPLRCHYCGKMNHKASDCWKKALRRHVPASSSTPVTASTSGPKGVVCYRCGEAGHIASRCALPAGSQAVPAERRVNICEANALPGRLEHTRESYPFYFDSGAECSLIKENLAKKFTGTRKQSIVRLIGLGNSQIYSTEQIISDVVIDGHNFKITFHILPGECIKYDIVIGRDLLQLGFGVIMTEHTLKILEPQVVNSCSSEQVDRFNNIDTDLPEDYKSQLLTILNDFSEMFISGLPRKRVTTGELNIRLKDPNVTVQRRPYRLSPEERQIVRTKIKELLDANIIRPSCSPFASPIILVKKRDGSDRMCVDYRELNNNTVPDRFPLPIISDQISRLYGAQYYSCLDCASGFNSIPVSLGSIERTAFVTPDGQYEYLAMPFGLRNAPSVFQRAASRALGDLVYSYAVLYMDDILVPSVDIPQGLERLRKVLTALNDAGFSLNLSKCSFLKTEVEFLGYEISADGVRPNPRKIEALTKLPPPENVHQLRQFIGLASYFRKFVSNFSQIMKPLFHLTTNGTKFEWNADHEKIRQQIISTITDRPVLMIFDPDFPTELHTDASADGYGAILFKKKEKTLRVVEYFSKRTTKAESKYHSYELETLAVVNAVKHFRHYLQGHKFTVVTDCQSLRASRNKIDLTPRVHRWWVFLQAFDFDIMYREGKYMTHVDFLSRNPLPEVSVVSTIQEVEQKRIFIATLTDNWLLAEQLRDEEIKSLVCKLNNGELPEDVAKTYEIRSQILHRKIQRNKRTRCLPIVPRSLRWSVINHVHESIMHLGSEKTLEKVFEHYWFEHMSKYVRKFVDNCITCKVAKTASGRIQAELHPIPKICIPWHTVHIDITGKLSGKNDKKEYVVVLIDAFTKFVLLYHTLRIDTPSVIEALKYSASLFGAPNRLIADQGRCFASKDFKEFTSSQNIRLHLIATGSSRANGQVERVMSTLKNMLTSVETSDRSWQDALEDVQLALNCTINRVTKASPLELLIGKVARPLNLMVLEEPEVEIDISEIREQAVQNIEKNASYDKLRFDHNKAKIVKFSVGDLVLIKNEERNQTKLDPKFKGPFKVIELLDSDRYVLKSFTENRTYKYAHDRICKMPVCEVPSELDELDDVSGGEGTSADT